MKAGHQVTMISQALTKISLPDPEMPPKLPSRKMSKNEAADKLKIVKCSVCEKQCQEKADCKKKDEI